MEESLTQQLVYVYTLYLPLVPGVILLFAFYSCLAMYLVFNKHVGRRSARVPGIVNCLVKITFRGSLTIKQDSEKFKEFRLFGYRVPAGLVNSLGLTAVIVWVGAVSAFWIVLIGKEQVDVIPEECQNNTINDDEECEPIRYNRVSLDYVRALGAAGGLLVLTTVIMHAQTIVIMWMMKKSRSPVSRVRKAWKVAVIVFTVAPLLIEIVTFFGAAVFILYLSLYGSIQNWIQFMSFMIAVFQSTYFPTIILYHTWRRRTGYFHTVTYDVEQGIRVANTTRNEEGVCNGLAHESLTSPLLQEH